MLQGDVLNVGPPIVFLAAALPLFRDCDAVHASQVSGTRLSDEVTWGGGTFGDALLAPTQIYVKRLLSLIDRVDVKARCVRSPQHRCSLPPDHHAHIMALLSRDALCHSITSAVSSPSWLICDTGP